MNSKIFFQPFVGKDYANGGIFGKRIMILGESHYCDESCADCSDCQLHRECMGFTQQVLGDYLNENKERQNWMRTFLKFERSLVGEETNQAMRLKIWNSVIFFNYLQAAESDGGKPSFRRLLLGLLAQGDTKIFEIIFLLAPRFDIPYLYLCSRKHN